jgi:2-deoxy-D-gluconate 3-dehydrogenase
VLAVARSTAELEELATVSPSQIRGMRCDMQDAAAVHALPEAAIGAFGRLDIVVNNAGIAPAGAFAELSDETWQRVFAINVTAPAQLTRAAGRYLLRQGRGKIINVASTSGILGKATLVAYSASKGALIQFTKALAAEWAAQGVQVNAIAPGAFATDAQRAVLESPELLARRTRKIPARRMGRTEEIGELVCYLASPRSDFVTGSVFVIDGGESSRL